MELVSFWKLPTKMVTLKNNRLNCLLQKLSGNYKYLVGLYSLLNFIDAFGSYFVIHNGTEQRGRSSNRCLISEVNVFILGLFG